MTDSNTLDGSRLVSAARWLRVLDDEYLSDYVPSGGSAVKFVSGSPAVLAQVAREVAGLVSARGLLHAWLDPAVPDELGKNPDLHRIDRFYFAVTRDMDWKACAVAQAQRHLAQSGIRVPSGRALNDLEGVAEANGLSLEHMVAVFRRDLTNRHLRDHEMGTEFRNAMGALVYSQLVPDTLTPTTEEVLVGWFRGTTTPGGSRTLKKVQVYERINAANAWSTLRSFTHWLPSAGHRGLVAVLDFRPYEVERVPRTQAHARLVRALDEALARGASVAEIQALRDRELAVPEVVYGQVAYLRMLHLLRQFIDSCATLERTVLVVLTSPSYYPGEASRSFTDYDALQTRIGLEVHDAHRGNPVAALVHLGGPE